MATKKKPEPKRITERMEKECTCKEFEWSAHVCPYASELQGDDTESCTCCPFCTKDCARDI